MHIEFFKSTWGMASDQTLDDRLRQIAAAGYDGVETDLATTVEPGEWTDLCAKHGLAFIAQVYALDAAEFVRALERVRPYQPILVNSQSGRDRMSFDEGCQFFRTALAAEVDLGIPVAHETHRHRLLYAPWTTAQYLHAFDDLRICADFSHWCVVCESLLADLEDVLAPTFARAIHIHARVGYEEGPQVPEPRAPEYERCLRAHESWWDSIRDARAAGGAAILTVDPEFGPPNYMHTIPYTQEPVADLWEVCLWMSHHLRRRWTA
jgi:sugar phosphate isomerase/epimerase